MTGPDVPEAIVDADLGVGLAASTRFCRRDLLGRGAPTLLVERR